MNITLHTFLAAVTDLGDSGVLLLLVLVTSVYLAFCKCGRGALAIIFAFLAAACGIGLAKLIFLGCGSAYDGYGIRSPSGHTALSLAVYAMLATLLASQWGKWRRQLVWAAVLALIACIAFSRVFLTYHSIGEVAVGIVIGSAAFGISRMFLFYKRAHVPPFNAAALLLAIIAACYILHGTRLPAESLIRELAEKIRIYVPFCGS